MKVLIFLMFCSLSVSGQRYNPVKWQTSIENVTATSAELMFTAVIDAGWSMYAVDIPEATIRPRPTSFTFEENPAFELVGEIEQVIKPEVKADPHFGIDVGTFKNLAVFKQKIKILKPERFTAKVEVEFMCCDDNVCLSPEQLDFEFIVNPPRPPATPTPTPAPAEESKNEEQPVIERIEGSPLAGIVAQVETTEETSNNEDVISEDASLPAVSASKAHSPVSSSEISLWAFFLVALLAGFGGVLTPCVYPMIPMTVSFFMRDASNRAAGMIKALIFGFSIMLIYTSVGVIVALTKRADLINALVSHWLTNLIFAVIFIAFAMSFFGLFEISLGSSLANKADKKADKGGYLSAFFMALALVLVSFSCTGPFVGSILVASTKGLAIKPILGMLGFGLAFALPFTLLAFFPSYLKKIPKSGGWMNSIKVVFAFVMIAFAFYFLSITDKGLGLNLISRDLFLCIWIVTFALVGFYLLGKIRFAHDSELPHINVTRLLIASASFVFALFLFTGLLGAPLRAVAGLLPASDNNRGGFSIQTSAVITQNNDALCGVPRFSENTRLSWPHGLQGYFDLDEALACAKEKNKPVLLIFKGHACAKCREMEALVWTDPEILQLMNTRFILLGLYTDDNTRLPENEWITSTDDGRLKRTMGQKNADFQITRYNVNAFPYHAILDFNGETIGSTMGYTSNIEEFKNWLKAGLNM